MSKRIKRGICGICPANCGIEAVMENGRITEIRPWTDHPQSGPCVRGRYAPEIIYSPDRIKRPLKRVGPKGTYDFREVSWDQALDEVAQKVLTLKNLFGPECIASLFGRGNFEQSLWQMLSPNEEGFTSGNAIFMPLGSPNAFSVGSVCFCSFGVLAPVATFGAPMGILKPDLEEAEVVFVWGTNPATDSPPTQMLRLLQAKKRGAAIIVIDPLKTEAARLADRWIPLRPGTDAALIYGILYQCFQDHTLDRTFGEQWCTGFAELESYCRSFTPDYVSLITKVPAETVRELAAVLTSTKKIAFLTYTGLEYSDCGVQSIRALLTLIALTGHLDVAGGQRIQLPRRVPFGKPDVKWPKTPAPIGLDVYPYLCKATKNGQFMEFPRSVLQEDPYKIRFLLIGGTSVLTSFPNTKRYAQALGALDYLVCVDRFLNADALYADMVLPATTYFENVSYCGYPALNPFPDAIQYRQRLIDPIGESMNDYLIYAKLAERLGYGHLYPQTEEEMVRFVMKDIGIDFGTFQESAETGPIFLHGETHQPYEERKWLSGRLRRDGQPGFSTPTSKWEFLSTTLRNYGYDSFPGYVEAKEGPENEMLVKEFPLVLTTGTRIQSTFRSQHLNIPGLVKMQPKAEILIHPEDAAARRIDDGDQVKVRTFRGEVPFAARVTRDILLGVVEMNVGGGIPLQGKGWRESNANRVTDDGHRDPISGFPVFKALLCDVIKDDHHQ